MEEAVGEEGGEAREIDSVSTHDRRSREQVTGEIVCHEEQSEGQNSWQPLAPVFVRGGQGEGDRGKK